MIELSRQEIAERLPHQGDSLYLDRATIIDPGRSALGWIDDARKFLSMRGIESDAVSTIQDLQNRLGVSNRDDKN